MRINTIQNYANKDSLYANPKTAFEAPMKILVVEDNPINQKVAQLFLKNLGYEADIAADGQQALAMFKHGYFLILMDVGLPDIDGLEITQRIRKIERSNGGHITIIAATANGESYRQMCLDAGMDDFMTKPILLGELEKILAKYNRSINKNVH